ncbi:hypothetical protein BDV32DRAFT_127056 [Aspergillus pseudonomiae]|nr:hypothetical protein BDV32DRAFT_127056 [Aspergillus pseudonomiae]
MEVLLFSTLTVSYSGGSPTRNFSWCSQWIDARILATVISFPTPTVWRNMLIVTSHWGKALGMQVLCPFGRYQAFTTLPLKWPRKAWCTCAKICILLYRTCCMYRHTFGMSVAMIHVP